jgi:hypothetical protein
MKKRRFDELTKTLAEDLPRREVFRRVFGLFAGTAAGALGLARSARAANQTSDCNHHCMDLFTDPHDRNDCKAVCRACARLEDFCAVEDDVSTLTCCTGGDTCTNGVCVPPIGPCVTHDDCPDVSVCIAGECVPMILP